jgi:hypothetical protein
VKVLHVVICLFKKFITKYTDEVKCEFNYAVWMLPHLWHSSDLPLDPCEDAYHLRIHHLVKNTYSDEAMKEKQYDEDIAVCTKL